AEDGDIYDCVDVNQQPAFKHPLLRDHKIQMEPSSFPIGFDIKSSSVPGVSQAELSIIDCPIGTIPILRNNNVDNVTEQHVVTLASNDGQDEAAGVKYWDDRYLYGTQATINVYEPFVNKQRKDRSASWIQIFNGPEGSLVGIGAGSWVSPSFSGDSSARFHISWTDELRKKFCIDHNCPGFVQVSRSVVLGGKIRPVSVYNGAQYAINVLIFKDPRTKHWWLAYGENYTKIGYWPVSQFSYLKDKAIFAYWGGFVQGPTASLDPPQMGSGHFACEGFGKAAFIRDIRIVNENNKLVTPDLGRADPGTSDPPKYSYCSNGVNDNGMYVYYGGPGNY
ncbi:hypothetical protein ABZP36_033161, partial [Zizania latifolia]